MSDALRPAASDALRAWAARVRSNREQVEQLREANPTDFYAPVAGMFRADPKRRDEPTLEVLSNGFPQFAIIGKRHLLHLSALQD